MFVYQNPSHNGDPYTVGYYDPSGKWQPVSDHRTQDEAREECHFLNGGEAPKPYLGPM